MSDFALPVTGAEVSAFTLVLARTSAWAMTAPIFAKNISGVARLAISIALAGFVTPLIPASSVPSALPDFLMATLMQVVFGLLLGYLQGFMLAAVETAGQLADLSSGFSYSAQLDPVSGSSSSVFTRLVTLTAMALLFVTDGASHIIEGFVRTFSAVPLDHSFHILPTGAAALGHLATQLVAAGLQIGAPLIGVAFVTDVGLALMSRFIPAANINSVGLSIKSLVALGAFGTTLMLLPGVLDNLVATAPETVGKVLG